MKPVFGGFETRLKFIKFGLVENISAGWTSAKQSFDENQTLDKSRIRGTKTIEFITSKARIFVKQEFLTSI